MEQPTYDKFLYWYYKDYPALKAVYKMAHNIEYSKPMIKRALENMGYKFPSYNDLLKEWTNKEQFYSPFVRAMVVFFNKESFREIVCCSCETREGIVVVWAAMVIAKVFYRISEEEMEEWRGCRDLKTTREFEEWIADKKEGE